MIFEKWLEKQKRRIGYWRRYYFDRLMGMEDYPLLPHSDYWKYPPEEIERREKEQVKRLQEKINQIKD